ncbi:MAG: glutamate--tRNA ligase [Candidatus Moeniiplasma glomeromycotorum]|nr:glutamate--tRNA ligase [Candidatus Moeniiplasma glomeromycotorum]MCE8162221.1 glutamate--tRNA ligase [Candidatus Moeniiplasma glomeromycotorum]MCE8166123.1 glutamate--tRNA ligase [Candidatus Moeniiplasma glomeromycotorum]MCE8166620.1 glutamate--tRNA ligase [Candidatus Moeniiplasma glomeromycotorum]
MNLKNLKIRTRFAPSPTGELHIGGVRTALFNYLWARQNQGQFILRIEDTDQERSKEEFITKQYNDLCWLGIKPDESVFQTGSYGPYRQTQRLSIYQKYVDQLIQAKKAYYCFCSPTELTQEKTEYIQNTQRQNYQYSRKCLSLTEPQIATFLQTKKDYLIRFQVPRQKSYQFNDLVRGKIIFQGQDIEDFVIYRSNGLPTFYLAVVIDDYLMKITHVLRGEEHLTNTAKQLVLADAFGWELPNFAHLSTILNSERKKMSKRDEETSQFQMVYQLREKGYLPPAIINYLLLLGWNPKTTQEIFPLPEAIEKFNLTGLQSQSAVFSLEKLNWYNRYYIQQLKESEFSEYAWQFLNSKYNLKPEKKEWTKQVALLFRPRLDYFQKLIDLSWFFFQEPPFLSEPDLSPLKKELTEVVKWEEENLSSLLGKNKNCLPILRQKLTGEKSGPELVKIMVLLGKEKILARV